MTALTTRARRHARRSPGAAAPVDAKRGGQGGKAGASSRQRPASSMLTELCSIALFIIFLCGYLWSFIFRVT